MPLCVILPATSLSIEIESALNFCRIFSLLRLKGMQSCNTCNASRISLTLAQTGFNRASSSSSSPSASHYQHHLHSHYSSLLSTLYLLVKVMYTPRFRLQKGHHRLLYLEGKIHQVFRSNFEDL